VGEGRIGLVEWARQHPWPGFLLVVGSAALAAAAAAAAVRRLEPHAEGSGIPRVEAVVAGRTRPGRPLILPVKFLGGLLSMGVAGLALGREGPSVQMGGNIGISPAGWPGATATTFESWWPPVPRPLTTGWCCPR
ncbi:MAG: chloride channel protein, partial [Arachnia sp.]